MESVWLLIWKAKCVFDKSKNKVCLSVENFDVYFNRGFPKKGENLRFWKSFLYQKATRSCWYSFLPIFVYARSYILDTGNFLCWLREGQVFPIHVELEAIHSFPVITWEFFIVLNGKSLQVAKTADTFWCISELTQVIQVGGWIVSAPWWSCLFFFFLLPKLL